MRSYLVESFLPRASAGDRVVGDERARLAAEALARSGTRVRFAGSIHVPEDELCLYLFDAPAADVASIAARNAGIEPLRIVEASSSLPRRR